MRRLSSWIALVVISAVLLAPRVANTETVHRLIKDVRHVAEQLAPALVGGVAATSAVVVGARLVGRSLRRKTNARYELLPGRSALAEPHEIAKAMDGIAGILRPRSRIHRTRFLGPESLALATLFDPATRSARFVLQASPSVADAVVGRLRSAYPGLQARPLDLHLPSDEMAVVRLKK